MRYALSNFQKCLGSPYGGAVTALAVTERALCAPFGGTSPKGRGTGGMRRQPCKFQFHDQLIKADNRNSELSIVNSIYLNQRQP